MEGTRLLWARRLDVAAENAPDWAGLGWAELGAGDAGALWKLLLLLWSL